MSFFYRRTMLVRGALLFALALMFQGIRLIMPLPPGIAMFLIGSLVNATLLLAVRRAGTISAVMMGALLPFVAFMQGQLPVVQMIPVVAAGNIAMVVYFRYLGGPRAVWLLPLLKAAVLYGGCVFVLRMFAIPPVIASAILFAMGWPQLVTATLGILLALRIDERLPPGRHAG